jgi:hypothetical protein
MGMVGARFAVFMGEARVLPVPAHATRNLSFVEVSPAPYLHRHPVVSLDWYGLI